MRSSAELIFRVSQEIANLRLLIARRPSLTSEEPSPLPGLPHPADIAEQLRDSPFAETLASLANQIEQGRIPMPAGTLALPASIDWRRDYRHGVSTNTRYFRLIPYLDFEKVGDHKAVWDLNRHQHLVVLAQAFLLNGRTSYVSVIQRHIETWLDQNPYMRGINWTSALEVGFRALSWMWVYHLVGSQLESISRQNLLSSLYQHGCYLEQNLSIYFSPNTHLLGEAVSLHAIGTLFPSFPRSARWRRRGAEIVGREMRNQVREDGSHFEQSTYYHVYALDLFLFHQILGQTTPHYQSTLSRMADFLDALLGPSRRLPLMGDDDGGRVFHPYGQCDEFGRATLATCAQVLKETNWAYQKSDLWEQAVWWLGAGSLKAAGQTSTDQPHRSRRFPDSGIVIMTAGGIEVLADAGPFGTGSGGHSHSDTLAVTVRDGPEEILGDAGTFTYVSDSELRNWFRSSLAHNTLRIGGRDQAVAAGPFRWIGKPTVETLEWRATAEYDLLDAICRYSEEQGSGWGRVVHRRKVIMLKTLTERNGVLIVICDIVDGPSGDHLLEQYWHPSQPTKMSAPTRCSIGTRSVLAIPNGDFVMEMGWRSRAFGGKTAAPMFVVRRVSTLPQRMWAAIGIGVDVKSFSSEQHGGRATVTLSSGSHVTIDADAPANAVPWTVDYGRTG